MSWLIRSCVAASSSCRLTIFWRSLSTCAFHSLAGSTAGGCGFGGSFALSDAADLSAAFASAGPAGGAGVAGLLLLFALASSGFLASSALAVSPALAASAPGAAGAGAGDAPDAAGAAGPPSALMTAAGFRFARRSRSFRAISARLWAWTEAATKRITIRALMTPIIHFKCRTCEGEVVVQLSPSSRVKCPHCNAEIDVFINDSILEREVVTTCLSCGHDALYVQKDFNRRVGMVIVGLGIAVSVYFFARSQPLFAMAALG